MVRPCFYYVVAISSHGCCCLRKILRELVAAETPSGSQAISSQKGNLESEAVTDFNLPSSSPSYHTPSTGSCNSPSLHPDGPQDGPMHSATRNVALATSTSSSLAHALQPQTSLVEQQSPELSALGSSSDLMTSFALPLHTEELSRQSAYSSVGTLSALWQEGQRNAPSATTTPHQHVLTAEYATPRQGGGGGGETLGTRTAPNLFDAGSEAMYGREPLGYNQMATLQPITASSGVAAHTSRFTVEASPAISTQSMMEFAMPEFAMPEFAMPEFALVDDTLTMWSSAPSFYG